MSSLEFENTIANVIGIGTIELIKAASQLQQGQGTNFTLDSMKNNVDGVTSYQLTVQISTHESMKAKSPNYLLSDHLTITRNKYHTFMLCFHKVT